MFPARFFPAAFFAPRFFPEAGADSATTYLFINFRRASDRYLLRFLQPQS